MLAEALRADHQLPEALDTLATAIQFVERLHERAYVSELFRLRGEIQLELGAESDGEASLHQALEIARHQKARMLELRAALVLARVRRRQDRVDDARSLLQPLDAWFTEGRSLPELVEMRTMLDELGA
jgi:hypothetical protein